MKYVEGLLPKNYGHDVIEIPGARTLLDRIGEESIPWAIVTSGTTPLISGWLNILKLPQPEHWVTAESVEIGKPDPTCYLMGRDKLNLTAKDNILVFEDSPAGIKAGKAAGCKVLGLVTSHTLQQVKDAEPDWIVKDLESVRVVGYSKDGVELEFTNVIA